MTEFQQISDDHPALAHSPLLEAACLTLAYAQDHGEIGLTATKAFKRSFVHWAVDAFNWPDFGAEEAFRFNKVLDEQDFVPLQVLHFLLLKTGLGRHYKGGFRLTARGKGAAASRGRLFAELIPFFILELDHASYGRFDERPFGNWDLWLNVLNVEMENGATEKELFGKLYREGPDWDNDDWREMAVFCQCVLKPLEWAGFISVHDVEGDGLFAGTCFKTPLWQAALRLETDGIAKPATRH